MHVGLDHDGRVRLWVQIALPFSASRAWEHTRQFARFTTLDPFHGRMRMDGPPRAGTHLIIEHGYIGWRIDRVGKILRWTEGEGYAFSDLSRRGPQAGFPHVYEYRIVPTGPESCLVVIRVRGKWTARFLPRWIVKIWLGWVMMTTRQLVENHILSSELRARRGAVVSA